MGHIAEGRKGCQNYIFLWNMHIRSIVFFMRIHAIRFLHKYDGAASGSAREDCQVVWHIIKHDVSKVGGLR